MSLKALINWKNESVLKHILSYVLILSITMTTAFSSIVLADDQEFKDEPIDLTFETPEPQRGEGPPLLTFDTQPQTVTLNDGKKATIVGNVVILQARTPEEAQAAVAYLKDQVNQTPNVIPQTIVGTSTEQGTLTDGQMVSVAKEISPKSPVKKFKLPTNKEIKGWFQENKTNLTLGLVRFALNGTVTAANLMVAQHLSFHSAAIVGLIMGSMSGLIQINLDAYQTWFKNGKWSKALVEKFSVPAGSKIGKVIEQAEQITKFFLTEVGFVLVMDVAMSCVGALHFPEMSPVGVLKFGWDIVRTSTLTSISQGIAEIQTSAWKDRATKAHPEREKSYNIRNKHLAFGYSAIWAISAACELMHMKVSWYGFGLLAAIGAGFYIQGLLTGKKTADTSSTKDEKLETMKPIERKSNIRKVSDESGSYLVLFDSSGNEVQRAKLDGNPTPKIIKPQNITKNASGDGCSFDLDF